MTVIPWRSVVGFSDNLKRKSVGFADGMSVKSDIMKQRMTPGC